MAGRAIAVLCAVVLSLGCILGAGLARAGGTAPTASVSGTLVQGGVLSGAVEVSLNANQAGAGVSSIAITVDGVQVVSAYGSMLWFDSGTLHDGSHLVAITMTDGAGDSGPVWTGFVQTDNAPQGGAAEILGQAQEGQTLVADPGSWSPQPTSVTYQWQRCDAAGGSCASIAGADAAAYTLSGADDYGRVEVVVTAADTGGSTSVTSGGSAVVLDTHGGATPPPLAAPLGTASSRVVAGAPTQNSSGAGAAPSATGAGLGVNATVACQHARLRATFAGAATVSIAFGRSVILRGSLHCGAAAVKHALLRVLVTTAAGDGPARRAQIRTRADGSFVYTVARGPSRRIEVSYRAIVDQRVAAASASASVVVTPQISLAVTPTHTSNGHTITFSGQVTGGDQPRGGLPLQFEYREGSQWMVYQTVRANPSDGRFIYRYTFERTTQPITYTFRFAIPPSGVAGYPYQPAASPSRSVHVDP